MINSNISSIIKARRAVFPQQFNGKKISQDIVLELLKNANTAPTHKLTQPWFFKVFSEGSKMELAKQLLIKNGNSNDLLKQKLINKFKLSSHIICICMRRNNTIPEWEEIAATAMAVQNIWISCSNSKIGGYWSTPKSIDDLHLFLKLKKNERCLGLFYLGQYDQVKERNIIRKNIEDDIEWFN